jgi:uncharacterized membrane protein YecN with MAPEG domain
LLVQVRSLAGWELTEIVPYRRLVANTLVFVAITLATALTVSDLGVVFQVGRCIHPGSIWNAAYIQPRVAAI